MVAVSALSFPQPDEYDIPSVGNNRRSQYYVLHDDGSYKYGYDTGEDAFESQKTSSSGQVKGMFGYRDPEGQQIRVQYTSGQSGFVAQGDHIPKVHPDVEAAFANARARAPFVDPLAGGGGDRSYNFKFEGEEHSRNEVSNSDGTVTGSYSYIDEFGRTRSYTYRAGKGIGFVIEGDDIPQQVQPLASHTTTTHFGSRTAGSQRKIGASRTVASQRTAGTSHSTGSRTSTQRKTITQGSAAATKRAGSRRQIVKPAQTYFTPTQSSASTRSSASRTASQVKKTSFSAARPATTRTQTSTITRTRPFEAANTRASQSPSGSYSVQYETSSHSRQESGDDNNNVRGRFTFIADDDNVERSINYEAGSATGFVVSGVHLPIGPIVPGAPTGQVTGRIVPVVQIPFIDPLAKEDLDASYNFAFESETYSRSETADEDGNISGTYSILGEDNILRTYRFRAGKGIGFETEEVSAVPSNRRSQSTVSRQQSSSSTFSHGASGSSSHTAVRAQPIVTAYKAPAPRSPVRTTFTTPTRSSSSVRRTQSSSGNKFGSSSTHRGTFKSSESDEVFPGFHLRQYDATEGRGKYGYVLRFDD